MNNHWLVLTDYGWSTFDSEEAATEIHCINIKSDITSYLIQGSTKDANGSELNFVLVDDKTFLGVG